MLVLNDKKLVDFFNEAAKAYLTDNTAYEKMIAFICDYFRKGDRHGKV